MFIIYISTRVFAQGTSDSDVYVYEPSSLGYLIGPYFCIAAILTFITPRLIPWLCHTLIPESYAKFGKHTSLVNTLAMSTLHAVIVSLATFYILANGCMENRVFSKCPLGFTIMQLSLGYFVTDFINCLLDEELRKDKSMLAHHLVGIIGICLGLYHQGKFMFYIVYRYVAESSTPFVNLFWLLRVLKKQQSTLFVVNSLLMVAVFFACRIAPIPWHWKQFIATLMDPAVVLLPWYLRLWTLLTYVVFDTLNFLWFRKMFKGSIKYFLKSDKRVVE